MHMHTNAKYYTIPYYAVLSKAKRKNPGRRITRLCQIGLKGACGTVSSHI